MNKKGSDEVYFTFTKKSIAVLTAVLIIILIVIGQTASAIPRGTNGATQAERSEFVHSLGYRVNEEDIKMKEITIPKDFSDVYQQYNKIQKKAGYDLYQYKGKKAVVYTYTLNDEQKKERVLNLIVCNGKIIGGDVSDTCLNGEMLPLTGPY